MAAANGWDEADCQAIMLAVDEALANIIRHAYHDRTDGVIEFECRETAEGLEFELCDHGDPVDKSKICARQVGCDKPGGLGTHIIKDVMDEVSYQAVPGGNRFSAIKRFQKKP